MVPRPNANSATIKPANPGKTLKPSSPKKMKGANRSTPSPPPSRLVQPRGKLQDVVTPGEDSKNAQHKYIHVHHFMRTNLFGAWFNDPSKAGKKQRLFFGSHQTAYLAARAQDRAALKYKSSALNPSGIKLNFREEDYAADEELRQMLTNDEFGELLRKESRPKYTRMEPTPCLRKFLEEEAAAGNTPALPIDNRNQISLKEYLEGVMRKRNMGPVLHRRQIESSAEESESEYESESESESEESEDVGRSRAVLEDPVVRNADRKVKLVGRFSRLTEILTQPASPIRTKRSRSEVTPLTILEPKEPLASKWGEKRSRTNATKSPRLPPRIVKEIQAVTKLPAKLHYKMQKIEKSRNSKTIEARMESEPVLDLPVRNKLQYKLDKLKDTKSPQESLPTMSNFESLVTAAALAQAEDARTMVSRRSNLKKDSQLIMLQSNFSFDF